MKKNFNAPSIVVIHHVPYSVIATSNISASIGEETDVQYTSGGYYWNEEEE